MTRFASSVVLAGLLFGPAVAEEPKGRKAGAAKEVKLPVDPVSGKKVESPTAEKTVYAGKTYYFESRENRETFERSPEKFVKTRKPERKARE